MLVDIDIAQANPVVAYILRAAPVRIGTGVYTNCGFNFDHFVGDSRFENYWYNEGSSDDDLQAYGVADSVEQFLDKFRKQLDNPDWEYVVGFTEVRKSEQPPERGWRWHKWGTYVGTRQPKYEYLYNEPDIESVVTFSVLRRKPCV